MVDQETAAGGGLTPPVGPDDHVRGPVDAPATVVVYGDYQCPYTRQALLAIAGLERSIGDRLRLVFRHFPLREIHPHAEAAAELAEAAADQGKFWQVTRLLAKLDVNSREAAAAFDVR